MTLCHMYFQSQSQSQRQNILLYKDRSFSIHWFSMMSLLHSRTIYKTRHTHVMIKDNVQFKRDKSYKNCFVKTYENEYMYLSTTDLKTFNDGDDLQ